MNPPRPNEGIDVGKAIGGIVAHYKIPGADLDFLAVEVAGLINLVRAETEAVVTRREREKSRLLVAEIGNVAAELAEQMFIVKKPPRHLQLVDWLDRIDNRLAAYEYDVADKTDNEGAG